MWFRAYESYAGERAEQAGTTLATLQAGTRAEAGESGGLGHPRGPQAR